MQVGTRYSYPNSTEMTAHTRRRSEVPQMAGDRPWVSGLAIRKSVGCSISPSTFPIHSDLAGGLASASLSLCVRFLSVLELPG
jgi:hypothetical protein